MSARLEAAIAELADALRDEMRAAPPPDVPAQLLTVDQAATALSIGRTAVYLPLSSGRLRSFRVGRNRRIPRDAIADFIAAQAG